MDREAIVPPSRQVPAREETRGVIWLMILRVVIVTTLMLSAVLVQSVTGSYFSELNPVYYLVAVTYLLTLVYAALYVWGRWRRPFVLAQLAGDLIIITGLIYYSGGLDSAFPFLYILTIITASILEMRRGGVWMALLACILYGALVALIYNGVIPPARGFLTTPVALTMNQVYYNLFVRWIGFVAAALLSSYIAEKLSEAGRTLKEQSADLEKMQVFYEDVINSVNSGLLSTDLAGRIGSLNHAGERILGIPFAEVVGRFIDDVLKLGADARLRLTRVGAEGLRLEHSYDLDGGGVRYLEIAISLLFDRLNLHRGYTFVIQDVSVLRQLEGEVRLKERMAAVGELAAGIAHEIRNPLASVSGAVQLLRSDLRLEGENRSLMDIVVGESDRLNRIIEEFLFYAKPSPPTPKSVDLVALVERTISLFRTSPELGPGHEIVSEFGASDLAIQADPDQLLQVLWNLLRNAIQAMPGGGRLWVRVSDAGNGGVNIEVEDEGIGFAEGRELDQVWEPFHASRTEGGVGLGLAIVYRIVRDHGGRVSLSNRLPKGARLALWLPRAWQDPRSGPSVIPIQEPLP